MLLRCLHFENEILVNCLFAHGSVDLYWIMDLEGVMHPIRDLWTSGFQECKGNGFFEIGRAGNNFWAGPKEKKKQIKKILDMRLPPPESASPEKFVGGGGGGV